MNTREAEKLIKRELSSLYDEGEAGAISSLLLHSITDTFPTDGTSKTLDLSADQVELIQNHIDRLKAAEPLQYILGSAHFYGMELFVDSSVLIPRPETEELVKWIIDDVKLQKPNLFHKERTESDDTDILKILDVGTGSGCIALALKKNIPKAEVWGCDKSDLALNIARRNGAMLNIRVDFQGIDFLDKAQQPYLPTMDIIVSNPPYIPESGKAEMHANVVQHEPHMALFVPDKDPLIFYKALAVFGHERLHKQGRIYMEIHQEKEEDVKKLFEGEGYSVVTRKDINGNDRMVRVELK